MRTEHFKEGDILICKPKDTKVDSFSLFAYISKNGTLYRATGFGDVMYACITKGSKLEQTFTEALETYYRLATDEEIEMMKPGSKLDKIIKEDN